MPRKGVIVYAGASDWFRGKIDTLYKGRKTLYRANFCYLPLGLCIVGLEHGGKAKLTQGSIGEDVEKNKKF